MASKKIINSLRLKDELCPRIWDNDEIKEKIREQLLSIAKFYKKEIEKDLDLKIKLDDIILTGSLANYNWSNYSDLDVHLTFDFEKLDDYNIVQKYLHKTKLVWGYEHNIKINGFAVEIYCQDTNENHESSGIFSLMDNKWIVKPTKSNFKIDLSLVNTKSNIIIEQIDDLYEDKIKDYKIFQKIYDKIWNKLTKSRKSGLEKSGELSIENLVFKVLRRNGYISKLVKLKSKTYDKQFK